MCYECHDVSLGYYSIINILFYLLFIALFEYTCFSLISFLSSSLLLSVIIWPLVTLMTASVTVQLPPSKIDHILHFRSLLDKTYRQFK